MSITERKVSTTNPLYSVFKKYKNRCKTFVETGTHEGTSIESALELGFKELYSVEINRWRAEYCKEKFEDYENVHLSQGWSTDFLRELLPTINERCLFWLDAHDEGGGAPTFEELDIIKQHHIKNHVIIIDDVPVYYGDGQELKDKILEISDKYNFYWAKTRLGYGNYVLIASTQKYKTRNEE